MIKLNKKGASLVELMAAIAILGIASTTITSMIITSYKGQLRAQQYLLAQEIAKTYDSMLARDVKKANLKTIGQDAFASTDPNDKYIDITAEMLDNMTKDAEGNHAPVYLSLYSDTQTDHFKLNDHYYDYSNVKIRIYMVNADWGIYKTDITVSYMNDRQVTYNGSHLSDLS